MQAWSSFPVKPANSVPKQTDMTKENTPSQSLNNRLSYDPVFFVYDHNMLKKEEDDLKDAILYFSPEYMPADDQCALCGQLMGMAEFLSASISQSAPSFFKFDHEKFALKRIGSYSFGLQASVSIPDSVMSEQLMNLYEVFVTFHGSVDSVRLRFKDSHSHFLKEFSNIWKVILEVSKVSLHSSLSQTFNNMPCVHLPKSGSHLFIQASHLLQASQRRPYVLAGAIFYKNKDEEHFLVSIMVCNEKLITLYESDLYGPLYTTVSNFDQAFNIPSKPVFSKYNKSMQVVKVKIILHLPKPLQKQEIVVISMTRIPYIAKNTETDMPKGCKTITMFLTDHELRQITPQHSNTNRHCKSTNFHQPIENTLNNQEHKPRKKLTRRLTCSSVPEFKPDKSSQSPSKLSEQNLKQYLKNSRANSKQHAFGIEQSTWGKNSFKSKMRLSHVPLVECSGGESLLVEDISKLGNSSIDSNFGKTYHQLELSQHLDSFALNASGDTSLTNKHHSAKRDNEETPIVQNHVNVTVNAIQGSIKDKAKSINEDIGDNLSNSVYRNITGNKEIPKNKGIEENTCALTHSGSTKEKYFKKDLDAVKSSPILVNGGMDADDNTHTNDNANVKIVKTETEIHVNRSDQSKIEIEAIDKHKLEGSSENIDKTEGIVDKRKCSVDVKQSENDISVQQNNLQSKENSQEDKESYADSKSNINNGGNKLNETDSGCFEVSLIENHFPIKQDGKITMTVSPRVLSESETEDEADILQESFDPCIACLDMNSDNSVKSSSTIPKCETCEGQVIVKQVIHKSGGKQEIIDFGSKPERENSDTDAEAQSDIEGQHFYTAKTEALASMAGLSSFSSDVSTDSSISRYWTYEMEGLNDVTVYVQCHSEISLLLIMDNPEQYEENLFHSLWKGSLNHLADLDYYITESLENEESMDNDVSYKFARFDAFSSELNTNIGDVALKRRDAYQQQMLSVLHSDFRDRHCLTDVTLRSHLACCYGHHREGEETFFQPDLSNRAVSGLPTPKDPAFNLDTVAKRRLAEDKKITML